MPRRREVPKRPTVPDSKHGDQQLGRFINVIMRDGKKSTAESIVYGAFDEIENKMRSDPLAMFRRALDNIRPRVEVKSRRVGGATYQVPIEVSPQRATSLAMRWLSGYAKSRPGKRSNLKLITTARATCRPWTGSAPRSSTSRACCAASTAPEVISRR